MIAGLILIIITIVGICIGAWSICRAGADADKAAENAPLTLAELKELDGRPVFMVDGEGYKAWGIVSAEYLYCVDKDFGEWDMDFYDMRESVVRTSSKNPHAKLPNVDTAPLHPAGWLAYMRAW